MDNTVKFTVEFDSAAWQSMDNDQRNAWIDRVNDLINEEAYVSRIETNPYAAIERASVDPFNELSN
ncbi:hypothetical protein SEA_LEEROYJENKINS_125 [Microbacterium phage LeeroyJenkins]|nr:hypothetical protein SEA_LEEROYJENKINS_125 [Microbacterium phage LeeroyJenkins]